MVVYTELYRHISHVYNTNPHTLAAAIRLCNTHPYMSDFCRFRTPYSFWFTSKSKKSWSSINSMWQIFET